LAEINIMAIRKTSSILGRSGSGDDAELCKSTS